MLNTWWLCSEVVIAAMQAIAGGTPDPDPLINSGVRKFQATDGMTHLELFKSVTRNSKQWSIANVYGVTQEETDAFVTKWPTDLEIGGVWETSTGVLASALHADLLLFMPDRCVARDVNGSCTETQPAASLTDVVLMMGQPPRELTP